MGGRATPYQVDGPQEQGKLRTALNSYCVNILGNWGACGNCHVGLGAPPEPVASTAQLQNIDCLTCHQEKYRRKKDATGRFVPDTAAMTISMDQAVETVHKPTRAACLQCHGKGGGGDNYKRGDLAVAHGPASPARPATSHSSPATRRTPRPPRRPRCTATGARRT